MEELVIQKHNFEASKTQLKKFSEQTTTELDLKKVNSSKDVGEWFAELFKGGGIGKDHKVTGDELNQLTSQVQQNLIDINTTQRNLIHEFGEVYSALEALDKDYIQAILISIEASRKNSEKIKDSQKKIESNQKDIQKNQKDIQDAQGKIEREGQIQKKTIKALQQFKEKLDKYQHISDIDKMWTDIQNYAKEIATYKNAVAALEQFKQKTEKYKHLSEIDEIWQTAQINGKSIQVLQNQSTDLAEVVDAHSNDINTLNEMKLFIEGMEHFSDIDSMWDDILKADETIHKISTSVENILSKINGQGKDISVLQNEQNKIIKQNHIYEIDSMWNNIKSVEKDITDLKSQMVEATAAIEGLETKLQSVIEKQDSLNEIVHLKDIDELYECSQENMVAIETLQKTSKSTVDEVSAIKELLANQVNKVNDLEMGCSKKIKIAYALAGTSIGIAVIELILMILRMM